MNQSQIDCFHLGVKALIVNTEGRVLLLQRNHPVKGMYWDLPGGRLQKGESQMDTLLREVREETGLHHSLDVHPFMTILTNIRISAKDSDFGLIFSVFIIHLSALFSPILSIEHINFEWCTSLEASERLKAQYPNELIEKIACSELTRVM